MLKKESISHWNLQYHYVIWLRIHEACDGIICKVSSGFNSLLNPVTDGIIIDDNESNRPKFKAMRFFAIAADTWNAL